MDAAAGSVLGAGQILALAAGHPDGITRASLADSTGLSRSTVTQRLDLLLSMGLLHEGSRRQSRGRPATLLQLNRAYGVVVAVDVGEDHARVAITDLQPTVLAERTVELSLSDGPERVLEQINRAALTLLAGHGSEATSVLGIGLALPGPVDFARGKVVGFSVLSGWDGFDIPAWFSAHFEAPVLVDNDVNVLALAEHRQVWPEASSLFFVKAGTGIGSGILSGDVLYRGAQGAAGDIGHIQLDGHGDPLCRCGNLGCVEALAGGWALVKAMRESGFTVRTPGEVVELAQAGVPEAIQRLRAAGRILGQAVAHATSLLNPAVIVIGGALSKAGEPFFAGVRETVYQRSLPLATRELTITTASLGEQAGVLGAAHLVTHDWLRPESIERMLVRLRSTP